MTNHNDTNDPAHDPAALAAVIQNIANNIVQLPILYGTCLKCSSIGGIAVFLADMYAANPNEADTLDEFLFKMFAHIRQHAHKANANNMMEDRATTPMPEATQ